MSPFCRTVQTPRVGVFAIRPVFCCFRRCDRYKLYYSLCPPSYPCRICGPAFGGGLNMTDRRVLKWYACAIFVASLIPFIASTCQAADKTATPSPYPLPRGGGEGRVRGPAERDVAQR